MMGLIAGSFSYSKQINKPCALTIGNFDGVHLGHQQLLHKTIDEAKQKGILSCVYTFEPSPRTLLAPQLLTQRIFTWEEKVAKLLDFGVDCVVVEEFSLTFAGYSPKWFANEILQKRLQVQSVIVGHDFRYGKARGGTFESLKQTLKQVDVIQIAAVEQNQEVISSSRIRKLVQNGQVREAGQLLGEPYHIRGIVVLGNQKGRDLGFPTANIFSSDSLIPEMGVYAVKVQINRGQWYHGMANLGNQPTFGGRQFQIEVHIFDFHQNIYGDEMGITFIEKIRAEKRFSSQEELIQQLHMDQKSAMLCLETKY